MGSAVAKEDLAKLWWLRQRQPYLNIQMWPMRTIQKLQFVQNMAADVVDGGQQPSSVEPLLWWLHWLLACFWAHFVVLVLTFKALYSLGIWVQGIWDICFFRVISHPLQTSEKTLLDMPSLTEVCGMTTRQRAFLVHPLYRIPSP